MAVARTVVLVITEEEESNQQLLWSICVRSSFLRLPTIQKHVLLLPVQVGRLLILS
jgi:hypothetical protein